MFQTLVVVSLMIFTFSARADLGDLRSMAREVRFGLSDHGRSIKRSDRFEIREDLLITIRLVEHATGHLASASPSMIGLATSSQRLLEAATPAQLSPELQRSIEHHLARAAFLAKRREE